MKIICHRGLWKGKTELQNSKRACLEGLKLFDGIEIDLKNKNGKIILSHDPILSNKRYLELSVLFKENKDSFYALNIKEDGLGPKLKELITKYNIKNYMCFDLSSPEEYCYLQLGLKVFKRFGDQDFINISQQKTRGLVFDIFNNRNQLNYLKKLNNSKLNLPTMIISPELHNLSFLKTWKLYNEKLTTKNLYICTDHPFEAREFFENK